MGNRRARFPDLRHALAVLRRVFFLLRFAALHVFPFGGRLAQDGAGVGSGVGSFGAGVGSRLAATGAGVRAGSGVCVGRDSARGGMDVSVGSNSQPNAAMISAEISAIAVRLMRLLLSLRKILQPARAL